MAASVTRLTLYAIVSAIEEDLRNTLATYLPHGNTLAEVLGEQLFIKLLDRLDVDSGHPNTEPKLEEILLQCDYGDAIQLANTHRKSLPEGLGTQLRALNREFTDLISIRNRVMHSRPLEFDDLASTTDICEHLLKETAYWPNLSEIRNRLTAEPEFVIRLSIPFERDESGISHNLPLPDFDETGFIGRRSTSNNLIKALQGVYPVITIVGEGGLGKTSLALKVAYELLDQKQVALDAITFVSAKTQRLTENEIQRIKGAINTSVGVIESAAEALGGSSIDDLIGLMSDFKVLLIIDNLETVLDDNIRELMEKLPSGSKVLITTRIRMGAFEFPIQLEPLSSTEAVQLLRATAKVRECARLVKTSDSNLAEYCRRMRNNPLHIKWFVSAVQAGQRPEAVLADEKIFLQFCLSNVFNVISEDGRKLVRTLLSLGGSYTVAELSFLTSMDQTTLIRAIGELTRTNMFFSVSSAVEKTFETKYELSQLARAYLSRFYPVNKEEQQRLLLHKQKLISAGEQVQSEARSNPLSASTIHCRSRSDWVIARYLKEALTSIREDDIDKSLKLVEEAKTLTPDFSEVYRIEAFAYARSGNITSAYDSYERAIELDPNSAVTRILFGGFLLRDVHDTEAAAEQFMRAAELCPDRAEPRIEYVRSCLYLRKFEEAEATLEQLERLRLNHELLRTKVTDAHLQLYTRKADHLVLNQEPTRALQELQKAHEYFLQIPHPDSRMIERIGKARVTAIQVRNALMDDREKVDEITNILGWIDQIGGQTQSPERGAIGGSAALNLKNTGTVKSIHRSGRFGFIVQDEGQDLYFHMNRTLNGDDLGPGCRVRFDLNFDWRGRLLADKVRSIDPDLEE